jgi:hypothetical protein
MRVWTHVPLRITNITVIYLVRIHDCSDLVHPAKEGRRKHALSKVWLDDLFEMFLIRILDSLVWQSDDDVDDDNDDDVNDDNDATDLRCGACGR